MKPTPSLYNRVRERQVLLKAWRVIRQNARRSGNRRSQLDAERFEENLLGNIQNIQRRLQRSNYTFAPAIGVAAPKGKGKVGKRAIVIAPIGDRIVQRAILDILYEYCPSDDLRLVLRTPTSVGGVPGRGVGHALAQIAKAEDNGAIYGIRSDIRNFFPSFPRKDVLSYLEREIDDTLFLDLFERAVAVELENREALGCDADLFPLGEDGVAQGSPLSVLAGNIVLRQFDAELNSRGVTCVRYIDDFLILANSKNAASKALKAGLTLLSALKLKAYAPEDGSGKAEEGLLTNGFEFLGYSLVRGLNPPSPNSRAKFLSKVEAEIAEGKKWIARALRSDMPQTKRVQCYAQTLNAIDNMLRGWAGAFQHTSSAHVLEALDIKIDIQLAAFERWFGAAIRESSAQHQRRALGIRLLGDSETVPLPSLDAEEMPRCLPRSGAHAS